MTTFTTEDREKAEKPEIEWEEAKEPIPFAGMIDVNISRDEKEIVIKKTWEF